MKHFLLLLSALTTVYGYHILCLQSVPSRSHYHLMKGIVDPLLKAGHQITLVTAFPDPKPTKNLKLIDVSPIQKLVENMDMTRRPSTGMSVVKQFSRNISRMAIQTPAVRDVLVQQQFDAVVSEWFFSDVEAGYAAVQQVPWILLSGVVMHPHMEYLVDTVKTIPTLPVLMNDAPIPMNFWQRIVNTFMYLFLTVDTWMDRSMITADYEAYFAPIAQARGISLPPFSEALHNVSILLLNSHPSFAPAQSLPPNVVEIGGYHIEETIQPLTKDLKDLLDASPQGVVYFSMGSVLKCSMLPAKAKKELIQLFKELPQTILWKCEEKLEGLSKNVHLRPWMPQASILEHPNVKVFITHGGLLSTLESLQYGVPLLAVPVFGDQPVNAQRSVRAGHALKVDFSEDMAGGLRTALKEMLSNDSYYKRAKYLSSLFRSRPVKPAKLIQHYVELAIESKGAYHLRSKSYLYSWYQLWMLDQVALLLVTLYVAYRIIRKISCLFCKKQAKGRKEKKN